MTLALGLAVGVGLGALVGLLGGGGSILAVPALVYLAGQPLASAVPTSLLVVGATAATAVVPRARAGQVQWRIAAVFGGAGALTAVAGAAVHRLLPEDLLLALFAVLVLVAGWRMLREQPPTGAACAVDGGRVNWRRCLPRAVGSGLVVGFLTGLLGVGGGFLVIPALVLLLGLGMDLAIGTSLVIIALNAAAGFAAHVGGGAVDWPFAAAVTAAAVLTGLLAARLGRRLPEQRLRTGFAVLVLVVGVAVLVELTIGLLTG